MQEKKRQEARACVTYNNAYNTLLLLPLYRALHRSQDSVLLVGDWKLDKQHGWGTERRDGGGDTVQADKVAKRQGVIRSIRYDTLYDMVV